MIELRSTLLFAAATALSAMIGTPAAARPAVVELFTSQGCSSCPPADALLGELARRNDVLALAFHVDYWDDLGWQDRFHLPVAAQRQSQYARRLRLPSVYTPQMVIDCSVDVLGSDRGRVAQLVGAAREGVPLRLLVQDSELIVRIGAVAAESNSDVLLVSFLRAAETAIGRGENSGRLLREYNIVRSISTLGNWRGAAAEWHVKVNSLPADASNVAVIVQQSGAGVIVGAASAMLPK